MINIEIIRQFWHEVTVAPYTDPTTGLPALIITQSDATGRAETEAALSRLNEVRHWSIHSSASILLGHLPLCSVADIDKALIPTLSSRST